MICQSGRVPGINHLRLFDYLTSNLLRNADVHTFCSEQIASRLVFSLSSSLTRLYRNWAIWDQCVWQQNRTRNQGVQTFSNDQWLIIDFIIDCIIIDFTKLSLILLLNVITLIHQQLYTGSNRYIRVLDTKLVLKRMCSNSQKNGGRVRYYICIEFW